MSAITLDVAPVFPEGTVVPAYPADAQPSQGGPVGGSVETETVTDGQLTYTTLTSGTRYAAIAQVGGVWRRYDFIPGSDNPPLPVLGNDPRLPSLGEKAALVGTSGVPSEANSYVSNLDPRWIALAPGVGRFPWINVRDLSGTPGSVTDWGPLINTAISDGFKHFIFEEYEFPFHTQIDLDGTRGITFEGSNGRMLVGGATSDIEMPDARLIWQGSGDGLPVKVSTAVGFTMRDLGLFYDNSGGDFTGRLISGDHATSVGTPSWMLLENCDIGAYEHALNTALVVVDFDAGVCHTVRGCLIGGANWGILGAQSAFSNAHRIENNMFYGCSIAHLGNVFQQWGIQGNTFEMSASFGAGVTPAVIDSDVSLFGLGSYLLSQFSFRDNWVGDTDVSGGDGPLFQQRDHNVWQAIFDGDLIGSTGGPEWQFRAGGEVTISNERLTRNESDPVIDCGSVGGSILPFDRLTISDNSWVCLDEAVINRTGHRGLVIENNGKGGGARAVKELEGYERITVHDREPLPTVILGAALPNGSALSITGNDSAGILTVVTGASATAGIILKVTFGTPMESSGEASGPSRAIVDIFPLYDCTAEQARVCQDAGLLDGTGFWVKSPAVPTNTTWQFGYRVVMS